jgi:hypothetical protein
MTVPIFSKLSKFGPSYREIEWKEIISLGDIGLEIAIFFREISFMFLNLESGL